MDKDKIENAIGNAVSNVACESGKIAEYEWKSIRQQLLDGSESDKTFIHTLVKGVKSGEKNNGRG